MGGAVLPHGQAAVGAHHLDIQPGIGDGVAHLLPRPPGGEHGKGVGEGLFAAGGQAGGHAGHVGLGNAHVVKAVGMGLGKALGHGGAGQIRVQHHQLRVLLRQGHQGLAVGRAGCNLLCHAYFPSSSATRAASSARAFSYCSALGALPCQP